jgi:hypothetical protein
MQDYYYTVKQFQQGQFDIIVDWTYEDCSVRDMFEETEEQYAEMERRLDAWIDTHYIARVRAIYNGVEMGSDTLGSCYAYNCTPEDDINDGIGGHLAQMVDTAVSEAQTEAERLLSKLSADFSN